MTIQTSGIIQIGWAHSLFLSPSTSSSSSSSSDSSSSSGGKTSKTMGDGVGDDKYSWSWDGSRSLVFHGTQQEFKSDSDGSQGSWKVGDVIRCALSFEHKNNNITAHVEYWKNGVCVGRPFSIDVNKLNQHKSDCNGGDEIEYGFFPAFSLEEEESLELCLSGYTEDTDESSVSIEKVINGTEIEVEAEAVVAEVEEEEEEKRNAKRSRHEREEFDDILKNSTSSTFLESFSFSVLSDECIKRGLKHGGTIEQKASRLYIAKDMSADEIASNPKLRAKK